MFDIIGFVKSIVSRIISEKNTFTTYVRIHNPKRVKAIFDHFKESEAYELLLIAFNLACEKCLNGLKTVDPDDKTSIAYLQAYSEMPNFLKDIVEDLCNKKLEEHIKRNVKKFDKILL